MGRGNIETIQLIGVQEFMVVVAVSLDTILVLASSWGGAWYKNFVQYVWVQGILIDYRICRNYQNTLGEC